MARRIARHLGIPFYAVDARDTFRDQVVQYFLDGYAQNTTPNPCLACNRSVRWTFLLQHALDSGAQYLATGHYTRLQKDQAGRTLVLAGLDSAKDQSYVLHVLNQEQLSHALVPPGEYAKPEVRQLARDLGLPVAERAESQDLCFLGSEDYRSFLLRHAPQVQEPGPILDRQGRQLGVHQGLAFYTIGQRKGLLIASPEPLYVAEKDLSRNALIVGLRSELGESELTAAAVNWVSGTPPAVPARLQVKIRYRSQPAWALVTPLPGERLHVRFEQPLRDITPGQAAVVYDGPVCLGGGIIQPKGA